MLNMEYEQLIKLSTVELADLLGVSLTIPSDREGIDLEVRPRSYFIQIAVQQLAMEKKIAELS